jgi:glycosyltransferase involved in cell wall biosynthesis
MSPKLSILIPTKDRYQTLIPILEAFEKDFESQPVEVVVQDNTEDNNVITDFISTGNLKLVKYFHIPHQISMSENCNQSVLNGTGEYMVLIGDDDYVFPSVLQHVKWMEQNNIEALSNVFTIYQWKGVQLTTVIRHIPEETYILPKGLKNTYKIFDSKKQLEKMISLGGAYGPQNMPRLYHGIVKKAALDRVFKTCGTYFPGPSPDMAVAIAVSCHIEKHAYYKNTFTIAGVSKSSNTGLGNEKKNIGKLEDIKFLDKTHIDQWDERIPKIWAVSTIWPQSMVQSLKDCNHHSRINLSKYYGSVLAYSAIFSPPIVKKMVIKKIWATKNPLFFISVFFFYCKTWYKRFKELFLNRYYHVNNVKNIADTYKIAQEKYGNQHVI